MGSTRPSTASSPDVGLVVQGGLFNALERALQQIGLADAFGDSRLPILVLNVTYPLVPRRDRRLLRPASARCWCSRRARRNSSRRTW
jgi:TPP-dependent indolepyruvate ferredoxin oxidoreductase alpha subunit